MRTMTKQPPTSIVFADGTKRGRELALHPDAIGVAFKPRTAEDMMLSVVDGVAVLAIEGPLEHKGGSGWWCYWENYERIAERFCGALLDPAVSCILLKFDSPGGEVSGLTETVRLMRGAKQAAGKPVIAYVDEDCYSAAYALAMVADEIYLPDAGGVGSIGVITAMVDVSAHDKKEGIRVEVIASGSKKADGHPHVPLSDGALKRTQRRIDTLAGAFFELVSEGRGLKVEAIKAMEAGVFAGAEAVDVGLADGVMSLAECLTLAANVFGSPKIPTDQSAGKENVPMSGVLAALKQLNEANAQLAAAKTDKDRAMAAALVEAAEAKYKHEKKTTTTESEEGDADSPDGEEGADDSSEDSDDEDGDDKKKDDEDDSDAGSEADSDADEDDASDNATTGLHTKSRLLRLARQITGKKSIEQVMGALHAMGQAHKQTAKLSEKVAKLEADARSTKVRAMVERGIRAGKLAPTQREWARGQTPAALKAFLETAPKMVHTSGDEHTEARVEGVGARHGAVTAEMARIWKKQGFAEKDFPGLLARMNGTTNSAATGANGAGK